MSIMPYSEDWPDIDLKLFVRSVKLFAAVKKMLGVNINLHAECQIEQGDIFVFNHFSRFETFIPQYLIHEKSGAYSCAIAAAEFFQADNALSRYLKKVGVFPHDHPRLLPLLAAQVLRGRKVIIFPEGGMVKDRRVLDRHGRYSIFSRITGKWRQHHRGAAVLALGIEAFKAAVRDAYFQRNDGRLQQWQAQLGLENLDQLLAAALKPTLIVPANITFYPIRSSENLLQRSVELFSKDLTPRQTEELLVEGNIMLKDTDMDIRMGTPLRPETLHGRWDRFLLDSAMGENSLDGLFAFSCSATTWRQRRLGARFVKKAAALRDRYMAAIYANVTINLSHLASSLILYCLSLGQHAIEKNRFYTALYIAVKHLQNYPLIHLHRSLLNPDEYDGLPEGTGKRLEHFLCIAKELELLAESEACYRFLPKLCEDHELDRIRLDNPIAVYHNEAAPIREVRQTVAEALCECDANDRRCLTAWRFEDEHRSLAWERQTYSDPRFDDINGLETADRDPSPFFLQPKQSNGRAVLLIHGLLASPAEVIGYGQQLFARGYTVLGIRLKGHGTSPYALRDRSWEDWYASALKGLEILTSLFPTVAVVGFSTGGALALKLAAERQREIACVAALSVPVKFINPALMLVPLLHGANQLVSWVSSLEGVKPFIDNMPEHPDINYRSVPMHALYELRRLVQQMDLFLPDVQSPVLLVQGDGDPVVAPESAKLLLDKIGSNNKRLEMVRSERHGILTENLGQTWKILDGFIDAMGDVGKPDFV